MDYHLDDYYSEKDNKKWLRSVLVQYSNMVNKTYFKSESGHSNQTRFNASDVNKAYKLIYENSSNQYSESIFRIKDFFREDLETLKTLLPLPKHIASFELELAKSIFLYICRFNFLAKKKIEIKYVLEERVDSLGKIISSLKNSLTDQTPKGIHDKIESFISDINELKESLNIRYKIHNNEGDHISFNDLCMATNRKDPKSFYLLVKKTGEGSLVSFAPSTASMISARKWYMYKGYGEYKDIPYDAVTKSLLTELMRV